MKISLSKLRHLWVLDLDGTLLKHNGYKVDGHDSFLINSNSFINQIRDDMIIFTTSRDRTLRKITEQFLNTLNLKDYTVVYNCPIGERIIVNDIKPKGLQTAIAINVERDNLPIFIIETDEFI